MTNNGESYTVFGTPEFPYCVDKYTDFELPSLPYHGTAQYQRYSFTAFKWHDTSSSLDEEQKVSCDLELSAEPFAPQDIMTCDGQEMVTLVPPDTTADVEVTAAPTPEGKWL